MNTDTTFSCKKRIRKNTNRYDKMPLADNIRVFFHIQISPVESNMSFSMSISHMMRL